MSQTQETAPLARDIAETQQRIDEQRAYVQRMIMLGCASQMAEDKLAELYATLRRMRECRPVA